jgi:hypothetical protein
MPVAKKANGGCENWVAWDSMLDDPGGRKISIPNKNGFFESLIFCGKAIMRCLGAAKREFSQQFKV